MFKVFGENVSTFVIFVGRGVAICLNIDISRNDDVRYVYRIVSSESLYTYNSKNDY